MTPHGTDRSRLVWLGVAVLIVGGVAVGFTSWQRARSRSLAIRDFSRAVLSESEAELRRTTRVLRDHDSLDDGIRQWIESSTSPASVTLSTSFRVVVRETGVVDTIVRLLDRGESDHVRRTAIDWLASVPWNEIDTHRPLDEVLKLARDDRDSVVQGQALTLAAFWSPNEEVERLARTKLNSGDTALRLRAVAALLRCSPADPAAVEVFGKSLDTTGEVHNALQYAALVVREQEVACREFQGKLVELVRSDDPALRSRGLSLVGILECEGDAVLAAVEQVLHENLVARRELDHGASTARAILLLQRYGPRARAAVPDLHVAREHADLRGYAEDAIRAIESVPE